MPFGPPGTTLKEAAKGRENSAAGVRGLDPARDASAAVGVPVSGSAVSVRYPPVRATNVISGSGERGLAVGRAGGDVGDGHAELVVLSLKTTDLVFEVAYPLLKPSHLRDHTRVGAADVAEQSLRHDVGPPH